MEIGAPRFGERRYADAAAMAAAHTERDAVMLSMHSGSVRYYGAHLSTVAPGIVPGGSKER